MGMPSLKGVPNMPRIGPVLSNIAGLPDLPGLPPIGADPSAPVAAPQPAMGASLLHVAQGGMSAPADQASGPINYAVPSALTAPPAPAEYAPPHHSKGQIIGGIIADALAGAAGHEGSVAPMWQHERDQADARNYEAVKWQRDRQGHLADYGAEKQLDQQYGKPEAFEQYATARGFAPGTPDYAQAVQDYRLGAWSAPALDNRTSLEDRRAGNRSALQTLRDAERLREVNLRVGAVRRGQDFTHADRTRGQDFQHQDRQSGQATTDARVRGSASYLGTGGRGRGMGGGAAAMATGPNGHQIVVKNGRWVDAQTGAPVQ